MFDESLSVFLLCDPVSVLCFQALLKNPVLAAVLDQQLEDSGLSSAYISSFLFNGPESERPAGMPASDWRNVFNATSGAAQQIIQILAVRLQPSLQLPPGLFRVHFYSLPESQLNLN